MTANDALINIKNILNTALKSGLVQDMDQAHLMRESFITVNNIVITAVQQQQAQKAPILEGAGDNEQNKQQ